LGLAAATAGPSCFGLLPRIAAAAHGLPPQEHGPATSGRRVEFDAMPKPTKKPAAPESVKKTSLNLPLELWERAKVYGIKNGIPFQDLVARALDDYLKSKH
jgi:hypothetical protein